MKFRTPFRRGFGLAAMVSLAALGPSCGQAILVASPGSTMVMFINPPSIALNGDTAVVSVLILEKAGTPAPDGTVVQFFTTLGRIQEQARTNDGVARVNLISEARSGTATVTAVSGGTVSATTSGTTTTTTTSGTTATGTVEIGRTRPDKLLGVAVTPRIDLSRGESIAMIKATVLDDKGDPVAGIPVRFTITDDRALDRIIDSSEPTTNNNGDAVTRVQTTRTVPGTIKVHVIMLAESAKETDIEIPVIKP